MKKPKKRKGRVIYSKKQSVFVQMDKNFQICDLLSFDKKKLGDRVYPDILNMFRGRPLYTAWLPLIEAIKKKENGES